MPRIRTLVVVGLLVALAIAAAAGLAALVDPTPSAESSPATTATTPRPRVVSANFIDQFRGLDATRWVVSDGWSNGDWVENDWQRHQVNLTPEGLAITMDRNQAGSEKPYASGEIVSHEWYRYGYFEARMRVPRGDGVVTGLFTFTRPRGNSSWHEIDMEFVGRDTRTLELAYHVEGHPTKHLVHLPFDAAAGFHTYAFEWRPDAIRWYVDNVLVHEARGRSVERMDAHQRFIVNLWNTAELHRWTGTIRPRDAPWTLTVSCMAQAPDYQGEALCPRNGA